MTPSAHGQRMVRPCVRLVMPSVPRYLAVTRAALRCISGQEGFAEEIIDKLVLATDEALANVIKHGYDGRTDGPIEVFLRPITGMGRRGLDIVVLDRGKSIEPCEICGRDLADLRPGGLGVHIIRSVMDKVQYRQRKSGGMLLRMVKYGQPTGSGAQAGDSPDVAAGTR